MPLDTRRTEAVFVLNPPFEVLEQAPLYRDLSSPADRLRALGRALASSPGFRDLSEAVLVVRTEEPMRLALIGRFTPAEATRIGVLPAIVEKGLLRFRYVSYDAAEHAARSLARQLEDYLGAEALSRSRFVAVPRGGLFVLGMLAYLLDLRADQVGGSREAPAGEAPAGTPLVVVDDCALSGLRFAETLERIDAASVVFAHLFSHPLLRKSIEKREERVVGCFAGEDLVDLGDDLLGEDRGTWEARWRDRSDGRAYWIGLPEHVCFPWNEPDITVWNTEARAEEAPWRIVPPELCLKNRPVTPGSVRFQEQDACRGAFRTAEGALYARFDDGVLVADAETDRAYSFPGIAGEIWTGLVAGASRESLIEHLVTDYEVEAARVREDVDSLVDQAIGHGLLIRTDDAGADA